jgi:hypothetical protein
MATVYAAVALALVMAIVGYLLFALTTSNALRTIGVLIFCSGVGTSPAIWLMYRRARG